MIVKYVGGPCDGSSDFINDNSKTIITAVLGNNLVMEYHKYKLDNRTHKLYYDGVYNLQYDYLNKKSP